MFGESVKRGKASSLVPRGWDMEEGKLRVRTWGTEKKRFSGPEKKPKNGTNHRVGSPETLTRKHPKNLGTSDKDQTVIGVAETVAR